MRSARELPRAIIDTNVIVSGTIIKRGNPFEILRAWRGRQFTLLMSQEQRDELGRVLSRPKIHQQYEVSPSDIADLFRRLDLVTRRTVQERILPVLVRDKKDEVILASALEADAEYLVTGDADLLVLRHEPSINGLKIVTAREFLEILRTLSAGEGKDA
jgi:putative PIN family toxin of toxin-antitoxin system